MSSGIVPETAGVGPHWTGGIAVTGPQRADCGVIRSELQEPGRRPTRSECADEVAPELSRHGAVDDEVDGAVDQ